MLTLTEALVAFVALSVGVFILRNKRNSKYNTLPPGPWGLPIVGHIPFLGTNPAAAFMRWTKIYGSIFTVRFGSIRTVVLNDAKSVKEAFSMHEFSGRPLLPVFIEMTNRKGFVFNDGPHHVEQRRYTVKTLQKFGVGVSSIEIRMQDEIAIFIKNMKSHIAQLSGNPMQINTLFRFAVINLYWNAVMGSRFDENDPTLMNLIHLLEIGIDMNRSPIAILCWFFPWISNLGLLVGYNPTVKPFKDFYAIMAGEIEKARSVFVKGESNNFTQAYFNTVAETTDPNSSFHASHENQAFSTGEILMAALETTTTTLDWILLYVASDSNVQGNLHAEIDSVIGRDKSRVPCLQDQKLMPYTEAILNEVLRISSLAPFAVQHRTVEDVIFRGYKYPKDTMVISNIYALHKDPNVWENPDEFNPGRFLDDQGQINKSATEMMVSFGIGKRNCPGEKFARDQLFLLITNFFREFRVGHSDNIPSSEPVFGATLVPLPFELFIHERC